MSKKGWRMEDTGDRDKAFVFFPSSLHPASCILSPEATPCP